MTGIKEYVFRARCYVCGWRTHPKTEQMEPISGEFHERFIDHPMVAQAIAEVWDRDLRSHLVHCVARRMFRGDDHSDHDALMPDAVWIKHTRMNAERYRLAAEWRAAMAAEFGSMDAYYAKTRGRERITNVKPVGKLAMEVMQTASRNQYLHREPLPIITERSRRMSGDSHE